MPKTYAERVEHFCERARERGLTQTDPFWLFKQLSLAYRGQDHALELFESVIKGTGDTMFYRFMVDEGIFFAPMLEKTGIPTTFMTHDMMRKKKWRRKYKVRGCQSHHVKSQFEKARERHGGK